MFNVKILDNLVSHEPKFITDTSNIHFIRNTILNGRIDMVNLILLIFTNAMIRYLTQNKEFINHN